MPYCQKLLATDNLPQKESLRSETENLPMSSSLGSPAAIPWACSRVLGYFPKREPRAIVELRRLARAFEGCEVTYEGTGIGPMNMQVSDVAKIGYIMCLVQ